MRRGLNGDMNRVQTDVIPESSIYQAVVESIAKAEGTEPTELTPPLDEVIDPEALERLFANNQALGKVTFNYKNHEVCVFSDEFVSIKSHSI